MIRFRLMAVALLLTAILYADARKHYDIIPAPKEINYGRGQFVLSDKDAVCYKDTTLKDMAMYLSQQLGTTVSNNSGNVMLNILSHMPQAAYTLDINRNKIVINAGGREGIASAISTVRQLKDGNALPVVSVKDSPRFKWRGFMLDVSRHFFDKHEVMSVIDSMAVYKFNKFHWHLTDDQGWRIEISKYPLLTEKGAWRIQNDQDTLCNKLYKETKNPAMLLPRKYFSNTCDSLYGGYYTKDDIREIVAFAYARGIDVIPEIDMPGHCLSIVSNYDGISCFDRTGWGKIFSSPMCPGKDKALQMCKNIFKEVFELFPYKYVHIGGDEVDVSNWEKCQDCKRRMEENNLKDAKSLQSWFNNEMNTFFKSNGKSMMAWDETVESSEDTTTTIMWWRNWSEEMLTKALNNGNDVIMCPMFPMYLSNPSGKNTPEAIDLFDPLSEKYTDAPKENIIGIQTCVWTERIPSYERLMQIMFPQFRNVSRKAWQ